MNTLIYGIIIAAFITIVCSARHRLESYGGINAAHIEYDDFINGKTVRGPSVVGPRSSPSQLEGPHIGLTYVVGPELGPPRIVTPIITPGHITDPEGSHDPIVGPTVGVFSIVGPPNSWSRFSEPGYVWKNSWLEW